MIVSVTWATQGPDALTSTRAFVSSRRHYGSTDLALAEDIARRAAVAVDNALLLKRREQTQRLAEAARERLTVLADASQALTSTLDYELPASMFPATAHYAALGHLHRHQEISAACPAFYSGSPLAIDFGEEANESVVLVVTAEPGIRADVRPVPVTGGRALRTLRGTLEEVIAAGEQAGDAYLRVVLAEPGRAGLGDLVRDKLPNVLEVQLDEQYRPQPGAAPARGASRASRTYPPRILNEPVRCRFSAFR